MKNNRVFTGSLGFVVVAALLALSGCASNSPAPVVERSAPPAESVAASQDTYVIKPGDTVYSIAREHKMDFRELIALNNIDSPNRITPGRVLKIKPPVDANSAVVSTAPVTNEVVVARPIGGEQGGATPAQGANTDTLKREPKAGKVPYSDEALAKAQNTTIGPNPGASQGAQSPAKPAESGAAAAGTEAKPDVKPADNPAAATGELVLIWPANGKIVGSFGDNANKGIDIAGKAGDPIIAAGDGKVILVNNGYKGYGKLVIVKHDNNYLSVYAHNQAILVKEQQTVNKGQKIAEMGNSDADQVMLHFEVRRQGKPVDPLKYLPQR